MKKIFVVFFLFAPCFAFADVRINEIAWMGDKTSAYNEWIELYNDGDTEENLSGWSITSDDEKFSVTLSKTIQPKGYFLLEHMKADVVPNPASDILSYTGGYFNNNGGIILLLKNKDTEIQRIDAKLKWPAGNADKSKEETMQLNGNSWITASATKKGENRTENTANTPAENYEKSTADRSEQTGSSGVSAHTSPLPLSDFSQKQEIYISAGRNRIAAVGSSVLFEAYAIDAKGTKVRDISSVWSFGDGAQSGGIKVSHIYKYPGDYAVILNASAEGNEAVSRSEVRVFTPKLSLAREDDGAVSVENGSDDEINLGGWKIIGANASFVVPSDTIIEPKKKIVFSKDVTGMYPSEFESFKLASSDGIISVDFVKTQKLKVPMFASSTPLEMPASFIEKKNEPAVSAVAPAEKTKMSEKIISQPVKNIEEKKESTPVSQTITLKKPEGFFSKMWNFFFR